MHRYCLCAVLCLGAALRPAQAEELVRSLDIWFIDVEGGAATLVVTPTGESVLIDCGNPGARDAERIHKVAKEQAGLDAIDHLVITHWHADHYGGVGRLAKLLPIRNYYDRGIPETLPEDRKNFPLLISTYKETTKGKSRTLKPGDELPLTQKPGTPALKMLCLCGGGGVIPDKPGARANSVAKDHKAKPEDPTDNAKSLGFLLTYGPWRFLDLGDLTWNVEHQLVSATDKIGQVDVFQVTHHGQESSNNPVLVKTVNPRVAVHNNGARKGCHASVQATLRRLPEIKAIYQLHRNLTVGAAENSDPEFIANPDEKCQGESIRLTVEAGGTRYQIKVGLTGKSRTYETRGAGK